MGGDEEDSYFVDGQVFSADGTKIAFRRLGQGRPVVLVHGSGGGLDSWRTIAERIAEDFQVWLYARRGHGPSDVPTETNSFAREVDDVCAVLDTVRTQATGPVQLVGGSSGAIVALHAAAAHERLPMRLGSLALFEPPLFATGPDLAPVLRRYSRLVDEDDLAGAGLLFAREVARVPPPLLAALARASHDAEAGQEARQEARRAAIGSRHDLAALCADGADVSRWSAVRVPVLLTQGADTWEPMPQTMDALAAVLPHVQRVVWTGQSHFASVTAPELFADTVRRFLRTQAREAAPDPGA